MDSTLGITGYTIDSFQSTTLIPGLAVSLSGGVTTTTWTSLPNLLNDNFCGGLGSPAWAGSNVMTNQIANSFNNCSVPAGLATLTTFNYSPGTTSFGIGLGNFQSLNSPLYPITNHELFVNGVDLGSIESLDPTWTPGLGRNAYLVIDATGSSPITSVEFENIASAENSSAQEDALEFDHLAIAAGPTVATPEPGSLSLLGLGALAVGFSAAGRRHRQFSVRARRSSGDARAAL
jgi:hypothetical protein